VTLIVGRGVDGIVARVPNVVGLTLKDAKSRLWEQGLNVGTVTRGEGVTEVNLHTARVSRQTATAGSAQNLGSTVALTIASEEADK
jgi:beta-lactam-binding protein with PASTA domain